MYEGNAVRVYATETEPAVARQTEVAGEVERIGQTSEYLDKCLTELEVKLGPVLAQRKEAQAETASQPEPIRVPLAEALYARASHLETLRARVSSMISRLEL